MKNKSAELLSGLHRNQFVRLMSGRKNQTSSLSRLIIDRVRVVRFPIFAYLKTPGSTCLSLESSWDRLRTRLAYFERIRELVKDRGIAVEISEIPYVGSTM